MSQRPSEPEPPTDAPAPLHPGLRAELHRAKNVLGAISLNAALAVDDERPVDLREKARARLRRNVDELAALLDRLPDLLR